MGINSKVIEFNLRNLSQLVFEVTDDCNLRCKYCGYADLYEGYDKREGKYMNFKHAKLILDYLLNIWRASHSTGVIQPVTIGFYGGEPLLNMELIRKIVEYLRPHSDIGKKFIFNMTTNGLLLKRYADYLVDNDFRLLISLDGNREGQGYRVDVNGKNSFDRVFANVKYLQTKYPEYFKRYVMFNSVLHNKNSVESIFHFIKQNFDKEPSIAPLNDSGVRMDKVEEFNQTYRNYAESIESASNCELLKEELFIKNPMTAQLLDYIFYSSGNVYPSFNSLLYNPNSHDYPLTGTCTPFSKKMFVTVNGKILQCEKISHEFSLGRINDTEVLLDYDYIANVYKVLTSKFEKECKVCGDRYSCHQCVYQIRDLTKNTTKCPHIISHIQKQDIEKKTLQYLRKHPKLYYELLTKTVIR